MTWHSAETAAPKRPQCQNVPAPNGWAPKQSCPNVLLRYHPPDNNFLFPLNNTIAVMTLSAITLFFVNIIITRNEACATCLWVWFCSIVSWTYDWNVRLHRRASLYSRSSVLKPPTFCHRLTGSGNTYFINKLWIMHLFCLLSPTINIFVWACINTQLQTVIHTNDMLCTIVDKMLQSMLTVKHKVGTQTHIWLPSFQPPGLSTMPLIIVTKLIQVKMNNKTKTARFSKVTGPVLQVWLIFCT